MYMPQNPSQWIPNNRCVTLVRKISTWYAWHLEKSRYHSHSSTGHRGLLKFPHAKLSSMRHCSRTLHFCWKLQVNAYFIKWKPCLNHFQNLGIEWGGERSPNSKNQEEWKGSLILNSFAALHTWYPLADVLKPVAINQPANNE